MKDDMKELEARGTALCIYNNTTHLYIRITAVITSQVVIDYIIN